MVYLPNIIYKETKFGDIIKVIFNDTEPLYQNELYDIASFLGSESRYDSNIKNVYLDFTECKKIDEYSFKKIEFFVSIFLIASDNKTPLNILIPNFSTQFLMQNTYLKEKTNIIVCNTKNNQYDSKRGYFHHALLQY